MTPIAFEESLTSMHASLLKLVKEITYNNISDNCTFILNEIKNSDTNSFQGQRKRIKENNKQPKIDFKEVVKQLLKIYPNLHDINFYIHRSTKHLTVIDIRYYLKSSLGEEFELKEKNNAPMIHCKISIPPYQSEKKEKFNINWEQQTIRTKWRLFWAKKMKMKSEETENKIGLCDECESEYYLHKSKMDNLCPECAYKLYGYENCKHIFKASRCKNCYWDGKASNYLKVDL